LVLPREGAALKPNAIEFRWTASDRALFYEVRVLTADGDLLWQTRAEGTETHPPGDVAFRPGQRFAGRNLVPARRTGVSTAVALP
jgi:hypothetical protein